MPVLRLTELRETDGLTQAQLAVQMGVIQSCVSGWESENYLPKTRRLPLLAKGLGGEVNDLFADIQTPVSISWNAINSIWNRENPCNDCVARVLRFYIQGALFCLFFQETEKHGDDLGAGASCIRHDFVIKTLQNVLFIAPADRFPGPIGDLVDVVEGHSEGPGGGETITIGLGEAVEDGGGFLARD